MGHEIVYCVRCASRIAGHDKSYRAGGKVVCAACLPEVFPTLTPAEQKELSLSTSKMRAVKPPPPSHGTHGTSVRLTPVPRLEAPSSSSRTPLIACAVGAVVLLAGAATMLMRSTPPPEASLPPSRVESPPAARTTAPVEKEDPQLREAREAVESARAKARSAPDDLDGQIAAWEEAARKSALTPQFKEASAALQTLREKRAALKVPTPREIEKPAVVAPVEGAAKPPSAEAKAYLARWESAMAKASAREFEAAAAELGRAAADINDETVRKDAREDGERIQRARALWIDGQAALSQLARGQTISLRYRSETGERKQVDGSVVRAGNGRVEIRTGETAVFIEAEDAAAGSLAALLSARGDGDLRALAVLCLLEGDREGAERLAGPEGVPARYWDYARDAATKVPKPSSREVEARQRFYAAEREFAKMETLPAAVAKYKSLADDYADTRVVKFESLRIRKRCDAGRDYVFVAGAMKGTGSFGLAPSSRTEIAWISKANIEGSKETLENFVEVEFGALPEMTYRCWALVGGCCAETFAFYLQTTEAMENHPKTKQKTSIDPGSDLASVVKHSISGLKKTHEEHKIKGSKTHPKTAARWEWVSIPLPKYSAPGAKKVRLISDQQGFGVGAIVVSSTRTAAMADPELKEEVARVRSTYAAQQDGLVGWWRLDETAGSMAADAVEGGHPGASRGTLKWSAGKIGGALKFEGAEEVRIDGPYSFKMITVSAWVKHDGFAQTVQRYVTVGNEIAVIRCVADKPHFYIRTNGELRQLLGPNALESGKWTLITGTWDGTTQRMYKDGVLIANQAPGGTLNGDVPSVVFSSPTEAMRGLIDEVRLYNRALSDAEIQKLFTEGSAGMIAELGAAPPAPAGKPWRPLFDGTTLGCLKHGGSGWKIENGAIANTPEKNDAAQTRDEFSDGELRLRFEVKDLDSFWFVLRQGTGGYSVRFDRDLKQMEGKPHELLFTAQGEQVTATLDGKPVQVSIVGPAKSGCLQFNATGKSLRILSYDVR